MTERKSVPVYPQNVHVIWHEIPHRDIRDHKEIAGIVLTGWQDANDVVNRLRAADPDGDDYWKEEVPVITPSNAV
jgi:hypothetical protein